ncbi:hypothetical protein [Sporanaerobacter sp. PP17-6a]|jgi:tetrahydromethanopterin S-methyltransferase subunit G|uniref:hypothetical protein n=1 Tax=Sporanaerobacter sp. PP17-6a TaxID=1891289 RepID=UPI0008A03E87|nr:hypothetical protein [Sporanaerobacter sp. PP17-6a]SCL88125.1 hypothetical protein PP176A_1457 [Sporanaerobacter sp. PP17-6a]
MPETVIVAIISLAGTLCGSYFSQRRTTALITYRLEQLEKKVEKHNQLQDRMVVVEQSVKSAHHRIDELREDVEEGGKE